MIPKGSKNKEAAWLWATWATAPARQYRSTIEQPNAMIPRQSVWALDAYKEKYGWGNYIETVNGAFKAAGDWPHYLPDMLPAVGDKKLQLRLRWQPLAALAELLKAQEFRQQIIDAKDSRAIDSLLLTKAGLTPIQVAEIIRN